jgi:hypothetical protein
MPILRLWLGVTSLGATVCLGWAAGWCWTVWGIARALGGGDKVELLGIALPYPIWMTLLGEVTLILAFGGIYALFFPSHSDK